MTSEEEFERGRQRQQSEIRLSIVDALIAAVERRAEVFEVVEASADLDAALSAVAALLGISEQQSESVLDRQVYRFTVAERDQLRAEQTELRKRLGRQ